MLAADVNVLIYAYDPSFPQHAAARRVLDEQAAAESLALFPSVIAGFLRLTTDRRVFTQPATPEAASDFIDALIARDSVRILDPGERYWPILRQLVRRYDMRGADISDATLAACAIAQRLTWVSFDRGFARFRELSWVDPADDTYDSR